MVCCDTFNLFIKKNGRSRDLDIETMIILQQIVIPEPRPYCMDIRGIILM